MASENKGSSHIGISISDGAIVGVHLRVTRDDFEIVGATSVEMPAGAGDGSTILDPAKAAVAIRRVRRELNSSSKVAGVALLSPSYAMRTLRLPDVPPREQRTLARGELEESGGLPIGAGAFDLLWITSVSPDGTRHADVYAYTTADSVVESSNKALQLSGLGIKCIEPASISMMRTYLVTNGRREPVALLCPSLRHTDLMVHDGIRVRHLRRIPSGISDLPRARTGGYTPFVSDENDQSAAASNGNGRTRIEVDDLDSSSSDFSDFDLPEFTAGGESHPAGQFGEAPSAIGIKTDIDYDLTPGKLDATPASFLETEVARSLAFYARQSEESGAPRSLVILGPQEVTLTMGSILGKGLDIPVRAFDPFSDMGSRSPQLLTEIQAGSDVMAAAIGVALGAAGQTYGLPAVDISRQEKAVLAKRRAPIILLAGMAGSTAWMIVAALLGIGLTFSNNALETENGRASTELRRLKELRDPALKYGALLDAARAARVRTQIPIESVLGRVAAASRRGVSLRRLDLPPGGKLTIEGYSVNQQGVEEFTRSLGDSKAIQGTNIESLKKVSGSEWRFRLSGRTGKEAPTAPRINP